MTSVLALGIRSSLALGLAFLTPSLANAQQKQVADAAAVKVDAALPKYQRASGVAGNFKSVGSDTMANEMTLWAEAFHKLYPNVQVEIEAKGSGTAPAALIQGTSHFGPMSRPMKEKEQDDFEKAFGYKATSLATSIDMLAVYVNKDCPLQSLTLQQIDAIFSKTRKGGLDQDITTWGDLGLGGEWANKPISLYGRNSVSGTYGYFKEHALFKGDYKDRVKEQPGSSAVVQAVASDKFAMGYSGIGYKTADVRAVSVARDSKSKAIDAIPENAYSGDYPMARFLLIYVNKKPGQDLDPLRREFLKYVLSQQGQTDVVKDGYFPLPAALARKQLEKAGISGEQ